MGVGFIQLITSGDHVENDIFTKNPQITFFKIYYRRHSNFFINNYEINGNNIKKENLITFIIPKAGDLLSKSYVNLTFKEHYVELFNEYPTLYTTLLNNVLNLYDSYTIRVDTFSKNFIEKLDIIKLNIIFNNNNFFTIMSTELSKLDNILDLIKLDSNIYLETDINKLFYNGNPIYNYYSFNLPITNIKDINDNIVITKLINNIDFNNIYFIRIDIVNYNLSFSIKFNNISNYESLLNLLLSNIDILNNLNFKINKYDLYLSIKYYDTSKLNLFYNQLLIILFKDINNVLLEIIDNKIKSTKVLLTTNVYNKIINLFNNIDSNYYIYYNILYNNDSTNIQIYSMKNTPFFGNYINNDFNENLISFETQLISISNLCSYKLPINLYIRLIVSLVCYNVISIQEYIKIINNKKFDINKRISSYINDNYIFDNKILDILINPQVIIINKSSFRNLLYQYNIKTNYALNNLITPFTDRKISNYMNSAINYYLYYCILLNSSNKYNQSYDNFQLLLSQLIIVSKVSYINLYPNNINLLQNNLYNYDVNNNLFNQVDIISDNNLFNYNIFTYDSYQLYIINLLSYNYLINFITESITSLSYIYYKLSSDIYSPIGQLTNLIYYNTESNIIFPLSSYINVYTGEITNSITSSGYYVVNNINIFNTNKENYLLTIYNKIVSNINNNFNIFKTNFNDTITLTNSLFLNNSYFNNFFSTINQYYDNSIIDQDLYDTSLIAAFMNKLKTVNFIYLYTKIPTSVNLNSFILNQIFIYVDQILYNGAFQNYTFDLITSSGSINTNFEEQKNYLNFIFIVNSPIYRIYFLYTFLGYLSLDSNFSSYIPDDIKALRDLLLNFLLTYIQYFNSVNFNIISIKFDNYDLSLLYDYKYNLYNNFICSDPINIFSDGYFNYITGQNVNNEYVYMYNSSYFIKNVNDNVNYINTFKYNYDDNIIILILNIITANSKYFNDYDSIYAFVNSFFNKVEFDFNKLILQLYNIFTNNIAVNKINIDNFYSDTFYYNCYYTTNSIGSLFDNTNRLLINTTNNIYNITTSYNSYSDFNKNFYYIKNFNIKQYDNYLNNDNIINGFLYFYTLFNNLITSDGSLIYNYLNNLLNSINTYIIDNISYLNKYILTEYTFYDAINILNKYLTIFNTKNTSYIDLNINSNYPFSNNKYIKYNVIVIYLLYYSFVTQCCTIDVNNYINNANTYITFNKYVLSKYSINIYIDCINDLINLLKIKNVNVMLDYSSYYLVNNVNNINNDDLIENTNYLGFMEKNVTLLTSSSYGDYRIYNNQLNIYSFININNINYSINISNYEITFYKIYNNQLNNFVNEYNKILYLSYNKGIINKGLNVDVKNILSLQNNFTELKNTFYTSSNNTINNIYNNLYDTFNSNNFINSFTNRITNIIINIIKHFYIINNNYYESIYFKKCLVTNNKNLFINFVYKDYIFNDLTKIDQIVVFLSNYLNTNIITSLIFEKEFNRVIYLLATTYAINLSIDKSAAIIYCNNNSLYNFVKIYKIDNSNNKKYIFNTSLYQNQDIFQLFNYDNWMNQHSFIQNYWFNYIISNIEYMPLLNNSYYSYFIQFRTFCLNNIIDILDFKLDNNISVIDYFNLLDNIDEFHNFIYDFSILKESFSPNYIYNNIIELYNNKDVSIFFTINTDKIKKKIIIYLFMMFLIYLHIPTLLNKNLDLSFDDNTYLEYNFGTETVTFKLTDITNNVNNIELFKYIINMVYNIQDTSYNIPELYTNTSSLKYITEKLKLICNFKDNYIIFIKKYISSYYLLVGNEKIVNDNILLQNNRYTTYSNLVNRINTVYYNDILEQNPQKYLLTINTIKFLNVNIYNYIYGLNDTLNNTFINNSKFIVTTNYIYDKTDISNINSTFNLLCKLLQFYNITYVNINNDINSVIGNLQLGTNFINDVLENFKGISSNYQISIDLIDFNTENNINNKFDILMSRTSNIKFLSELVTYSNNFSLITPNDYDLTANNFNFLNIYNGFYKKYYNYDYNYYNFQNNYIVIYNRLFNYYDNILNNKNAINIIKKSNISIYVELFNDIIKTIIANNYFTTKSSDPSSYIHTFNNVINIYLNYNFDFRINKDIDNIKNLKIQNFYNKNVNFTSYIDMYNYIVSLYYYELVSNDIIEINYTKSEADLLNFFNIINNYQNYNLQYNLNVINYVYRFQIIIKLMIEMISINVNTKIIYDDKDLDLLYKRLLDNITSNSNISEYININAINTDNNASKLYKNISNITNYNTFKEKLSLSLNDILYYTDNKSYDNILKNAWNKYFANITFNYIEYAYNDFKINNIVINYNTFEIIIFGYINYIVNNFNDIVDNNIIKNITNFIINILSQVSNNENHNINLISKILFNENFNNYKNNEINNKTDESYFNKIKNTILLINKILLTTYWNVIIYNDINNVVNKYIDIQILFFNYYFSFMNKPIYTNFDYEYFLKNNYRLQILYKIIVNIIVIQYVNNNIYNNIIFNMFTNTHNYILYGNKIDTLDIIGNISTKLDYINLNIINNNIINNYYKNIQNGTINDIVKYKVNNFTNPIYNFDDTFSSIYDIIVNNNNITTETNIGMIFYNNSISSIINNYKPLVNNITIGLNAQTTYMLDIYKDLIGNINSNLEIYKNILGGYSSDINNINLTTQNIIQIFNNNVYEINNKSITIFTLIYNEFDKLINNDMVLILFYYTCYLTWLMIDGEKYNMLLKKFIYDFANLINTNIIRYTQLDNKEKTSNLSNQDIYDKAQLEIFFNGLNNILFSVNNNTEFSILCINFFENIIKNKYNLLDVKLLNTTLDFNIKTYNGTTKNNELVNMEKNYYNNEIYKSFIKNNKVNTWKLMQGIIVDYNESETIRLIKSMLNFIEIVNIQKEITKYITSLNNGIINQVGIIKLINNVQLLFDDEIIDDYNNQMYKIFINLFVNYNKYLTITEMLGLNESTNNNNRNESNNNNRNEDYIIDGLKPFILNFKNKNFILPINFFFKDYNNVIPLISCMYSQIKINLNLSSKDLIKNSYSYKFLVQNEITSSLNMDLILIEKEERTDKCSKQIDNLIEKHGYYSNSVVLKPEMLIGTDLLILKFDFNIVHLIKELFWTFDFYINKYKLYNNAVKNEDFIINTRFYMDGARRDGILELSNKNYNSITTILNSYKYNTKAYDTSHSIFNVYSFALEPEDFQPTGAMNMSNINIFTIEIVIDKNKLYNYIHNFDTLYNLNNLNITMNLNTLEYNFIRYQSGLSGLLFV